MMIEVGQAVRFRPNVEVNEKGRDSKPEPVVGTVIFVNPSNGFFVAEYPAGNGYKLREGFRLQELGNTVRIVRDER